MSRGTRPAPLVIRVPERRSPGLVVAPELSIALSYLRVLDVFEHPRSIRGALAREFASHIPSDLRLTMETTADDAGSFWVAGFDHNGGPLLPLTPTCSTGSRGALARGSAYHVFTSLSSTGTPYVVFGQFLTRFTSIFGIALTQHSQLSTKLTKIVFAGFVTPSDLLNIMTSRATSNGNPENRLQESSFVFPYRVEGGGGALGQRGFSDKTIIRAVHGLSATYRDLGMVYCRAEIWRLPVGYH
ncbi:hypothetical protein BOTBODRAFT_179456 [Botryobasidium botryosum FD-172 SS1]|uniref:Uncharacterized protein n=1 Tax=Botryobasidium botryosum (strain FD-172 SS1) TaxID=930990 RepID=A0A067M2P7_BOTB1|nr:hypothetical protein BOTBODRAFT_179456 [Botryobasidium botryosum FD-172 SS1]